jgi:hypothetical protein
MIWLHTFGERFGTGVILPGRARCTWPISNQPVRFVRFDPESEVLAVGDGRVGSVSADVWGFSVSGLRVVKSWLGYRVQRARRRGVSPLDRIVASWSPALTQELLELLWVLEATLELQPELEMLLEAVVDGRTL